MSLELTLDVTKIVEQLQDDMPSKLPSGPPLKDILHAIDLVPRFPLSNLPHSKMNLKRVR